MSGILRARARASGAVVVAAAAVAALTVVGLQPGGPAGAAPPVTVSVSKTSFADIGSGSEVVTVTGSGFDPTANLSTRPPVPVGQPTGVYVVFGRFLDAWKPSAGAPSAARKVVDQKWALPQASIDAAVAAFGPNPQYVPLNADGTFSVPLTISKSAAATAGNWGVYTYAAGGAAPNADQETFTPIYFPEVSVSKTSFADIGSGSEVVTVTGSGFDPAANLSTRPPVPVGQPTGVYVVFGRFLDAWKPSAGAPSAARKVVDQKWALPQASIDAAVAAFGPNPQYVPLNADGTFSVPLTISKSAAATAGNWGVYTYAAGGAAPNAAQETFTPVTFDETFLTLVAPARLLDTRLGTSTTDGTFVGEGIRTAGSVLQLKVADRGGVPATATSVAINLTAAGPTGTGYVTAWPCGGPQPGTSSLNFTAGVTVANTAIVGVGPDGTICLAVAEASTELIVDVTSYVPDADGFAAVAPERLLDTRQAPATPTLAVGVGATSTVQVAGKAGVPANAVAAVLNVTATDVTEAGYVTVWTCDAAQPVASNLNTVPGRAVAGAVVVGLSAEGTVCVAPGQSAAELIVDVVGYVPAGSRYTSLVPARLLDTRTGGSTIDGEAVGGGAVSERRELKVVDRGGVPADAAALVVTVTADGAVGDGYVTVWSCDQAQPATSNLNVTPSGPVANSAVVAVSAAGSICLAVGDTSANLLVDVNGVVG